MAFIQLRKASIPEIRFCAFSEYLQCSEEDVPAKSFDQLGLMLQGLYVQRSSNALAAMQFVSSREYRSSVQYFLDQVDVVLALHICPFGQRLYVFCEAYLWFWFLIRTRLFTCLRSDASLVDLFYLLRQSMHFSVRFRRRMTST